MKNFYNIDFDKQLVHMRCFNSTLQEYITAVFDLADLKIVDAFANAYWRAYSTSPKNPCHYVACTLYNRKSKVKSKTVYLHRLLMGFPRNLEINHIDGNAYNNRKKNLEAITTAEHRMKDNCKGCGSLTKTSKLKVRGVTLLGRTQYKAGKYLAYYSKKRLGYYNTLQEATMIAQSYRNQVIKERNQIV